MFLEINRLSSDEDLPLGTRGNTTGVLLPQDNPDSLSNSLQFSVYSAFSNLARENRVGVIRRHLRPDFNSM